MTEDFIKYLEMCVNFHHKYNESYKITDSAIEKENYLFLEAIHYINDLYKSCEKGKMSVAFLPKDNCYKCGKKLSLENMASVFLTSNPSKYFCKECAGEKKEKQYRPFKDCDELVKCWEKKMYIPAIKFTEDTRNRLYRPAIWVKNKNDYTERLIVTFGENFVKVGSKSKPISLYVLFTDYEFLDGTPCGITE